VQLHGGARRISLIPYALGYEAYGQTPNPEGEGFQNP
jgi:hypothetical protein